MGISTRAFASAETTRVIRSLLRNAVSVVGLVLIAGCTLVALLAPLLAPPLPEAGDPYLIPRDGFGNVPRPPGTPWEYYPPPQPFWWKGLGGSDQWIHPMGTASGQWDLYYGVVWGTRTAFRVGIIITALTLLIGVVVGSLAAYYGGLLDEALMRLTDIFMAFPFLVAALTLSAVLTPIVGRGVVPAMVALVAFGWMTYARLVRGEVLSVKAREYVLAARVVGVRDGRILLRHVLPNAIFPTLVVASMDIGSYVLSFAALSFLGVGAEVGYADWGQLLSFAREWITSLNTYWYIVIFPGLALLLFVLGWNLVGDALRDVLDPRLRGKG